VSLPGEWPQTVLGHLVTREVPVGRLGPTPQRLPSGLGDAGFPGMATPVAKWWPL